MKSKVYWVAKLDAPGGQVRVLNELMELMDEREFVEGRAACVTYEAELARRTGLGDSMEGVLKGLTGIGLLTSHKAAGVFVDKRPGLVFRLRRPDVVLAFESASPLWLANSWVRRGSRGQC